jgi:hypothetical protein
LGAEGQRTPYSSSSPESLVPDELLLGRAPKPASSDGVERAYAPHALEEGGALVVDIESPALAALLKASAAAHLGIARKVTHARSG